MPNLKTPGFGYVLPGPIVVGTDPGGSDLLRIGSGATVAGPVSFSGTTPGSNAKVWVGPTGAGGAFLNAPATKTVTLGVANSDVLVVTSSAVTIGTDPGGTEPLRVGGTIVGSGGRFYGGTVGIGGTAAGGAVRVTDDAGTSRWLAGILGSAGARDYSIYDLTGAGARFTIDGTTGGVTIATRFGCNGKTAQVAASLPAAATDAATTQALSNAMRTALINCGIGV